MKNNAIRRKFLGDVPYLAKEIALVTTVRVYVRAIHDYELFLRKDLHDIKLSEENNLEFHVYHVRYMPNDCKDRTSLMEVNLLGLASPEEFEVSYQDWEKTVPPKPEAKSEHDIHPEYFYSESAHYYQWMTSKRINKGIEFISPFRIGDGLRCRAELLVPEGNPDAKDVIQGISELKFHVNFTTNRREESGLPIRNWVCQAWGEGIAIADGFDVWPADQGWLIEPDLESLYTQFPIEGLVDWVKRHFPWDFDPREDAVIRRTPRRKLVNVHVQKL